MEWADLGTLAQRMNGMSEKEKIKASQDICDGLSFLHGNKLVHRDLTPNNILVFHKEPKVKISDFGTSTVIQTIQTNSAIGTLKYSAPELFRERGRYTTSADVYSFVVILYELFSGMDPFPGVPNEVICAKLAKRRPKFPDHFSTHLRHLIDRCWTKEPMERLSLEEISKLLLRHAAKDISSNIGGSITATHHPTNVIQMPSMLVRVAQASTESESPKVFSKSARSDQTN